MRLKEAEKIAQGLMSRLRDSCERIEIAGSIRRRKEEVNDIEILCVPRYSGYIDLLDQKIRNLMQAGILDYRLNKLGQRVYGPQNKLLLHVASGMPVDIFSTTLDKWWVALVVRTGSRESNIAIASAAKRKGWKFNSYGRGFTDERGREIVCYSERDVFELVGLPYRPPEER